MKELTKDKQLDLSIHGYAMDGETACSLHKIDGILTLVLGALEDLSIDSPVPDGVACSIWAVMDTIDALMVRGGIKNVQP